MIALQQPLGKPAPGLNLAVFLIRLAIDPFYLMSMKLQPVLAVWLLTTTAFSTAADEQRPNVLLVTIDTLRADRLGVYGYSQIETPNIDRLASDSMVFDRAISPVPLTLPSHASILSGVYPLYHGIRDNAGFVLSPQQVTLAEILKEVGYSTGAFVGSFILDSRFRVIWNSVR